MLKNTLWLNDECSKSKKAKELLNSLNIEYDTIYYMDGIEELLLMDLMTNIDDYRKLIRLKEANLTQEELNKLSRIDVFDLIMINNSCLQRPIFQSKDLTTIVRSDEELKRLIKV